MRKFLHFNNEMTKERAKNKRYFQMMQSRTVAIDPLSAEQILAIASESLVKSESSTVNLNIGITLLSKNDNYSKRIGRAEAEKRMSVQSVEVDNVFINDTHIFIRLKPHNKIQLNLRLNKKSGFSTVTGSMILSIP